MGVALVKVKPTRWGYGLKRWIEARPRRGCITMSLQIALANKLARIAWSVLARGRAFEVSEPQAA